MFEALGSGIESMYEISILSMVVAAVVALVRQNGGIQFLIYAIRKCFRGRKGAELGIAGISAAVDVCTANNTVAIVMAGGIVKEIGEEYEIPPKRVASILDIFTSVIQGNPSVRDAVVDSCFVSIPTSNGYFTKFILPCF